MSNTVSLGATPETSEIDSGLGQLSAALQQQESLTQELEGRLSRVLMDSPSVQAVLKASAVVTPTSPLGKELESLVDQAEQTNRRLQILIENCQL